MNIVELSSRLFSSPSHSQCHSPCLILLMIDVTDIDDVNIRDEVVLFGTQGENMISIEEVAEPANSFNYEMACHVSRRVPRVYYKDGKEIGEINYLV